MLTGGSGIGAALNFTPSREPDGCELLEYKACEGLCGGFFYRPKPVNAKSGERICPRCVKRMVDAEARDRELQARHLARAHFAYSEHRAPELLKRVERLDRLRMIQARRQGKSVA